MNRIWAVLLAVFLVSAPAGLAQKKKDPPTRSVSGDVTSASGQAVVGAVVQLQDTKTKQVRSFYTQDYGHYYFNGLSPDVDYELTASYQGASSKTRTLSVFDNRKAAVINLKLNPSPNPKK